MIAALVAFLKKNYLALLLAVVVGITMVLPQLLLMRSLGSQYHGIAITEIDNDDFYYSRIKDAFDGKFSIASPRVYNPSSNVSTIPGLGEIIVAFIAHAFQISVAQMPLVGSFLFPAVLYLVLYFLFREVTGRPPVALLVPLVIILASNIAFAPLELIKLFTDPSALTPSVYNRPIQPQISSIIFFLFLLAWHSFWRYRQASRLVLSGVLFGLLFYTYLFAWTFATVFLGLNLLLALLRRDYRLAGQTALVMGIGVVVSGWYWVHYVQLITLPNYGDIKKRFGFYESRQPFFSAFLLVDFILILLGGFFKRWQKSGLTVISLLVATAAIVINQQVVTGLRFFPGHYHWYYVVPLSLLIFFWAAYEFLAPLRPKLLLSLFLITSGMIATANGIVGHYQYYLRERPAYADVQRYAAVYQWINEHVDPSAVILSPEGKLSDKLTVFTSVYSYLPHRTDRQYAIPQTYFRQTYFTKLYLNNKRDPQTAVKQDDYTLMYTLFGYYNLYRYQCSACFSDQEIAQLKVDYAEYLKQDFAENLKQYQVNYAIWDTQSGPVWNLDQYRFMQFITEINGVRIYKVS